MISQPWNKIILYEILINISRLNIYQLYKVMIIWLFKYKLKIYVHKMKTIPQN